MTGNNAGERSPYACASPMGDQQVLTSIRYCSVMASFFSYNFVASVNFCKLYIEPSSGTKRSLPRRACSFRFPDLVYKRLLTSFVRRYYCFKYEYTIQADCFYRICYLPDLPRSDLRLFQLGIRVSLAWIKIKSKGKAYQKHHYSPEKRKAPMLI